METGTGGNKKDARTLASGDAVRHCIGNKPARFCHARTRHFRPGEFASRRVAARAAASRAPSAFPRLSRFARESETGAAFRERSKVRRSGARTRKMIGREWGIFSWRIPAHPDAEIRRSPGVWWSRYIWRATTCSLSAKTDSAISTICSYQGW